MAFKDNFRQFQNIAISKDILLRQVIPEKDAKDFYDIYSDEDAFRYFGGYKKPGEFDDTFKKIISNRIRNFVNGRDYSWTIVFVDKAIGQIQLYDFQNSNTLAEVGYFMKREYWNKGINTLVLKAVCNFAFETMKIKRIEAHAHINNIGSCRTLEKAGFVREGLLRQRFEVGNNYEDCYLYSLLNTD